MNCSSCVEKFNQLPSAGGRPVGYLRTPNATRNRSTAVQNAMARSAFLLEALSGFPSLRGGKSCANAAQAYQAPYTNAKMRMNQRNAVSLKMKLDQRLPFNSPFPLRDLVRLDPRSSASIRGRVLPFYAAAPS